MGSTKVWKPRFGLVSSWKTSGPSGKKIIIADGDILLVLGCKSCKVLQRALCDPNLLVGNSPNTNPHTFEWWGCGWRSSVFVSPCLLPRHKVYVEIAPTSTRKVQLERIVLYIHGCLPSTVYLYAPIYNMHAELHTGTLDT